MHVSVYGGLGSRVGCLPNLLKEMREYVRHRVLLETVYARPSHTTQRYPKSTTRTARFLDEKYGADGKSKRGWTVSNRACVTIGSMDVLRTPALVSASSFGSHTVFLTRYTSPSQTVGNSDSTRQSLSSPVRFQKYHSTSTVPN
jgi:hypothetical protein